jgi:hypothetical protein
VEILRFAAEGFGALDHVAVLFLVLARVQVEPDGKVSADRLEGWVGDALGRFKSKRVLVLAVRWGQVEGDS